MYEEKTDNKGLSFYGTFVLIYTVLNIAAFLILLLTTEWSVLADDEGDGFWAGFWFMVIGIAAALIHGIGPALMFKRRGNTRLLYLFPLAVMLVGFAVFPFESLAFAIGMFLIIPLGFPLFNCFTLTSSIFNSGIWDSIWFMSVTPAVIYALVIFATTLFMRRKQQSINARMKQ
ncbi:MAG: hypothetical protein IKC19_07150 [Bacteroidales bacterium]|nr:hypothetical protein [Bacteroidales bacterium]